MKTLHISPDLTLPLEAVTQTFAILAKRGVGKTYTGAVLVEEMLAAKQQVVVADPIGVWWGLRSKADGESAGFSIVVFGGEHADVPLDENAGEVIAGAIVEHGFSAILDLSLLRKAAQVRFMTAFAEALYRLNRNPLHFMVDEADAFAPQRPLPGEQRLLGAFEDIVRRGRARGLGVTLITQRAAVLNKNVLTQIEVLVILRTISPQDREAIEAWTEIHGTKKQLEQLSESMASLPIGNAWFWSPGWLDVFQRVQVRKRLTFDSSSTPKVGEKVVAPKEIAPVDLETLGEQIKATAARAKENDPATLKKQLAALKQELAQKPKVEVAAPLPAPKPVEVPVLVDTELRHIKFALSEFQEAKKAIDAAVPMMERIDREVLKFTELTGPNKNHWTLPTSRPRPTPPTVQAHSSNGAARQHRPTQVEAEGDFHISRTQQRILDALAWLESLGNNDPSNLQVGAVALIDSSGGHFSNTVGPLSSNGLIVRGNGTLSLTDEGRKYAKVPEELSTLAEYHAMLRERVRKVKSAGGKTVEMLDAIIGAGGSELSVQDIGEAVGIDHTGGHFSNMIGPLGGLGLITRRDGMVRPTEILFPEALR